MNSLGGFAVCGLGLFWFFGFFEGMGFVMATGIWPRMQPRTTDSHAEQRVYEALKRQFCRLPGQPGIPCAFVPPRGGKGKGILSWRSEGFAPEDIAVISLRGQTAAGGIGRCDKIGSISVVRADNPEMEQQVVADTFLRFKGLERPAIIVTDLRLVKDRADVRMHIALTRATDVVRVVGFALEEGEGLFQGMDKG